MWYDWFRSSNWVRTRSKSKSKSKSKSFSCSSFKDIQSILKDDEPEYEPEPGSPRSPFVFHRRRMSTSLRRSWDHKIPILSSLRIPDQGIVLYFTSLRAVRSTYEDCRTVRSILRGFRVPIDERDLLMDTKFLDELQGILGGNSNNTKSFSLPRVFIGGRYVGGAEEIKRMNETGELLQLISGLQLVGSIFCDFCGGLRFVLCEECNGSHKIYTEKSGFMACTGCNVNGVIRCPSCCPVLRRCT